MMMTLVDDVSAGLSSSDCAERFGPGIDTPADCNDIYDESDNKDCCEDHFNLVDAM